MAPSPAIAKHAQSFNATMLSTGQYSDLVLTCKGKEFKVHRNIVLLQSKPLAAAINGGFKESADGKIDLVDEEPDIVELFLKFLYTGEYDDNRRRRLSGKELRAARRAEAEAKAEKLQNTPSKRQKTNDEVEVVDHANEIALLTNTQVYIMAEKYDVQGLKELAKIKYEELVDYYWRRPSFVTTLRLLFEGTPESDPLMKVAIKTAGQNARELVDKGEFATLCKECGELGFEIFKASMEDDDKENEPTELATTLRVNGFSDSASDSSSHFD